MHRLTMTALQRAFRQHAEKSLRRRAAAVAHLDRLISGGELPPGYLAGLLHNTGWTVLLHALDSCEGIAPPFHAAFARRLSRRADRLFAKAVGVWRITAPLKPLCDEMMRTGTEGPSSPLATALLQADRAATLELLQR